MENNLNKKDRMVIKGRISPSIDTELIRICREKNWKYEDLIKFAVNFKFAEERGYGYPKNSLSDKLQKVIKRLEEKSRECDELREKLQGNKEKKDPYEELNELEKEEEKNV